MQFELVPSSSIWNWCRAERKKNRMRQPDTPPFQIQTQSIFWILHLSRLEIVWRQNFLHGFWLAFEHDVLRQGKNKSSSVLWCHASYFDSTRHVDIMKRSTKVASKYEFFVIEMNQCGPVHKLLYVGGIFYFYALEMWSFCIYVMVEVYFDLCRVQ